jgi:hypothetical protein
MMIDQKKGTSEEGRSPEVFVVNISTNEQRGVSPEIFSIQELHPFV